MIKENFVFNCISQCSNQSIHVQQQQGQCLQSDPICRAEHSQLSEQLLSGRQAFGIPGEHGGLTDVVQPQVQHGHSLQPYSRWKQPISTVSLCSKPQRSCSSFPAGASLTQQCERSPLLQALPNPWGCKPSHDGWNPDAHLVFHTPPTLRFPPEQLEPSVNSRGISLFGWYFATSTISSEGKMQLLLHWCQFWLA